MLVQLLGPVTELIMSWTEAFLSSSESSPAARTPWGWFPASRVCIAIGVVAAMRRFLSPAIVVMTTKPSGTSMSLEVPHIELKCPILVVLERGGMLVKFGA